MDTFLLVLILLFQIGNLILLAALANILVRAAERAKTKTKPTTNREQGLLDLPQVPNYAQVGLPGPSEGLVLVKDE
jgi:hypothetical protein